MSATVGMILLWAIVTAFLCLVCALLDWEDRKVEKAKEAERASQRAVRPRSPIEMFGAGGGDLGNASPRLQQMLMLADQAHLDQQRREFRARMDEKWQRMYEENGWEKP